MSRLPPELERKIFTLDAYHDAREARRLLFVAQRVKIWIEPLLWRLFIVGPDEEPERSEIAESHSSIPTMGVATFAGILARNAAMGAAVHDLFFTAIGDTYVGEARVVLAQLPHLHNLGLGLEQPCYGILDALSPGSLRRLWTHLTELLDPASAAEGGWHLEHHPALSNLTHLNIFPHPALPSALRLPSLTHFALQIDDSDILQSSQLPWPEFRQAALSALQRTLRALVIILVDWISGTDESFELDSDPRLIAEPGFVLFPNGIGDAFADWVEGATGGMDFWEHADVFIAKRRARLVDENTFKLEPVRAARPESPDHKVEWAQFGGQ
ncbi:hypothetical protein HMN09_01119100 [Mycena chlorophos]|uniref:F-box domain-containing protein n=1 Tax=Mycena chlorophos TaxID=658473 RepID=A0A8H6SB97_MYCCL|nr:hypothetical protein HMN09_01119100 [Mycena chlorophos]